jgi:hypothetical protein
VAGFYGPVFFVKRSTNPRCDRVDKFDSNDLFELGRLPGSWRTVANNNIYKPFYNR